MYQIINAFILILLIKKNVKLFFEKYNFDYIINLVGYVDHSSFFKENNKIIDTHFLGTINSVYYLKKIS